MLATTIDLPSGLVWADDTAAGIRRRRAGRGFVYLGPNGRAVSAVTRARVQALAVPPAWTDVWIALDENGHIQATGRDARGRKQYRYHARFHAHREEEKFARLYDFGLVLPDIRRQAATDLARPGIPREKVVATVIRLLEATLVRVGNEEYARANKSYGLTTLRDRHAQFTSDGMKLVFKGKHGISASVHVQDARLRRVVKRCQDLPGQVLFQYVDDAGSPCPITSTDVNRYLNDVTGLPITAKDFRTWMGTLMATVAFAELPAPASDRHAKRAVNQVLGVVSSHLGNTPAVCRASYIHPDVITAFADGTLAERWEGAHGPRQPTARPRRTEAAAAPAATARATRETGRRRVTNAA